MQSSTQFQTQPGVSGLTLVELDASAGAIHVVGVSAVWRKLLMQAEMTAPHLQVAAIEGEHGSGKNTLARYLFGRSPLAATSFQRRDAREWLATDADPASLAGFTYLDRVDLLAPPGQGLLLGVLKTLQDRPPGRAVLLASSQTPLRQMAGQGLLLPDLAFRLTAIRFAIPPLRKTSLRSPNSFSSGSASAISSVRCCWGPAHSPAFCSTRGPATCASCRASLRMPCSNPITASFDRST
jgi:hypothetical protein